MVSVSWHNKFGQFLYTSPLLLVPLSATNHILKLGTVCSERSEIIDGEYLIEAFLEGLNLNLEALMEHKVQRQIDVFLEVVYRHICVLAVRLKLYLWIAWESEGKQEIFQSCLLIIHREFKGTHYTLFMLGVSKYSLIYIFLLVC